MKPCMKNFGSYLEKIDEDSMMFADLCKLFKEIANLDIQPEWNGCLYTIADIIHEKAEAIHKQALDIRYTFEELRKEF